MAENRNERLEKDFGEMLKLKNRPYLDWMVIKGEPPCAEEYLLRIKLRTYVFRAKNGKCTVGAVSHSTIKVTLRDSYPDTAPYVTMLDIPPIFHPDWYSKGTYCPIDAWTPDTSLKDFILRMLRTLQYDPSLIKEELPANYKALEWFIKNRDTSSLFPSDTTVLTENSEEETAAMQSASAPFDEIVDTW